MYPDGLDKAAAPQPERAWMAEMRRIELQLCESLNYAPLSPDIEFVAFLRALSQFGFFRFGPITIDVDVVEDILLRTHPRGVGGPEHPSATDDYLRLGRFGWNILEEALASRIDERHTLIVFMRWGEGLPARVFGELGVSPEDVLRYIEQLGAVRTQRRLRGDRLLSTEEAAEYLGVHIQTVRAWIRSGKLPASRLAGQKSIRIRESDLESVLEPIDPTRPEDSGE